MSSNMMLTIAALVILTLFTISSNSLILQNKVLDYESEYIITAIGLAQSVIDEAKNKAFDETAIPGSVSNPASFTAPASLGRESGESFSYPDSSSEGLYNSHTKYDDVDDYHEYNRYVTTPRGGNYNINVRIDYVTGANVDQVSASQSYYKRMTVEVTSPYIKNPVYLKYAFSY